MHAVFYLTWLAVTLILFLLCHALKIRCSIGRRRLLPPDAAGRTARPLALPPPEEPTAGVRRKDVLPKFRKLA